MKLRDFGKWTSLYAKGNSGIFGPDTWVPGHVTTSDEFTGGSLFTNGNFVSSWGTSSRVTIPEFEISKTPTIRIGEIRQRRFNVIERAEQVTRQTIQAQEDQNIFDALDKI